MGPLDMPEEIGGHAFESLLLQELIAVNDYSKKEYKVYYWRTSNNIEIDFVLYGKRGIKAFEVKRTGKTSGHMLKALKTFKTDYPSAELYFVYGGERQMRDGDVNIVPIKNLLKKLPDIL
jgi:predicted AAA+ superfamily ATPase